MTCACGKEASAKGLCATCYQRQRRRKQGTKPQMTLNGCEPVTVKLKKVTLAKIRHAASLRGISVSEIIRAHLVKLYG
jgi:hypothetical protein